MLIWCVCDAANGSSVATVWGHMLSLITAEQSGPALINSTDMTIRNPSRKDHTVIVKMHLFFIKLPLRTHPHTNTHTRNQLLWAKSSLEESHSFDRKSVYCHCSLGRNDAYCWALIINIVIASSRRKQLQVWTVSIQKGFVQSYFWMQFHSKGFSLEIIRGRYEKVLIWFWFSRQRTGKKKARAGSLL